MAQKTGLTCVFQCLCRSDTHLLCWLQAKEEFVCKSILSSYHQFVRERFDSFLCSNVPCAVSTGHKVKGAQGAHSVASIRFGWRPALTTQEHRHSWYITSLLDGSFAAHFHGKIDISFSLVFAVLQVDLSDCFQKHVANKGRTIGWLNSMFLLWLGELGSYQRMDSPTQQSLNTLYKLASW